MVPLASPELAKRPRPETTKPDHGSGREPWSDHAWTAEGSVAGLMVDARPVLPSGPRPRMPDVAPRDSEGMTATTRPPVQGCCHWRTGRHALAVVSR